MPEIRIHYRAGKLTETDVAYVIDVLSEECSTLFSIPERQLTWDDFSIEVKEVKPPSRQTNDVIVRIALHNDPRRMQDADVHARTMAKLVHRHLGLLAQDQYGSLKLSVAVSLQYMPIEWHAVG